MAVSAGQMFGDTGECFRKIIGARLPSSTFFFVKIISNALEEHDGKVA